jgi:hypothetical protein
MPRSDTDSFRDAHARWAASGALALTGDPNGPYLAPPDAIVDRIEDLGRRVGVDAVAALTQRACLAGLHRRGRVSCGGTSRLLQASDDDWLAVTLARPDDVALVPAWLELDASQGEPWTAIARRAASTRLAALVDRGRAIGLAVARVGEVAASSSGVLSSRTGDAPPLRRSPLVVDLSALWAGPLCAHVLGRHGARVVKVESRSRPDGARSGPAAFFDLLHAGHESVALDLTSPTGRRRLRGLLMAADVVVEASRPRALQQLGIVAEEIIREGPRVWVSITGYGREEAPLGIAFGDDAAAAGGLVAWDAGRTPHFAVDAIADPLTGLVAADAALRALHEGGRWMVDVRMAHVAASIAGPEAGLAWRPVASDDAVRPSAKPGGETARSLGADTDAVLDEFALE